MQKSSYIFSITLIGMSAGILVALMMEFIDDTDAFTEFSKSLIGLPINLIVFFAITAPVFALINNIKNALTLLNDGKTPDLITPLPAGILAGLTQQVNAIIRNQQDFQAARGRLYEQISEVAAQEERTRLARDLHDSIKQQIFSISISAAAAHAHLENSPLAAREALLDVKQSAQEAMVEMRAMLQQLSPAPLEKSGLIEALREQCQALAYRTGAQVTPHFGTLPDDDCLPPGTQETIFRIAQEALSNIARHARAQSVTLSLAVYDDSSLILTIEDDGKGFDMENVQSGMGQNNMQSRAENINAQLAYTSQPGAGTRLSVAIPLVEPVQDAIDWLAQTPEIRKKIINRFYLFSGSLFASIFGASLIIARALRDVTDATSEAPPWLLLAILAIVMIAALPIALVAKRLAERETAHLRQMTHNDTRTMNWVQRHIHMAYAMIYLSGVWFVPMIFVNQRFHDYTPIIVALIFAAFILRHFNRMVVLYRAELAAMPIDERIAELDTRLNELRVSVFTIIFLVGIQIFSFNSLEDFAIPPQTHDHWMTSIMAILSFGIIINQIVSVFIYRRWRNAAQSQKGLPQ